MGPTLKAINCPKVDCPSFLCGLGETLLFFSFFPIGSQSQDLPPDLSLAPYHLSQALMCNLTTSPWDLQVPDLFFLLFLLCHMGLVATEPVPGFRA